MRYILEAEGLSFEILLVTWHTNRFLTLNNCTLCPHRIYVYCIYLRTNSDFCHLQHKLIGFYNRDEKCLQCGTDCGCSFVLKWVMSIPWCEFCKEVTWLKNSGEVQCLCYWRRLFAILWQKIGIALTAHINEVINLSLLFFWLKTSRCDEVQY